MTYHIQRTGHESATPPQPAKVELIQMNGQGPQLGTMNTKTMLQTIVMAFAILYWLSPIDAMPFLPFDDIAMVVAGCLFYTKNDAGPGPQGGDQ